MNVFISASEGYLGRVFVKAGYKSLGCDVTDIVSIERSIAFKKPELVIHFAGHDDPDWVERHPTQSHNVNVGGTINITSVCNTFKIPFVFISSCHVWRGEVMEWVWNKHSENSKLTPAMNLYGMQMTGLEAWVLGYNDDDWKNSRVIRASYIFDKNRLHRELRDLEKGNPVDAPAIFSRSFIHAEHFVSLMNRYLTCFSEMPPLLHLAGNKRVSYFEFWLEVAKQFGFEKKLVRGRGIEKDNFAARRPYNGGLNIDLSKSLGFPYFDYVDGIGVMKNEP